MPLSGHLLGATAALVSALAWAVGSILFRRIGDRVSPTALNLAKSLLGLVLLGTAALLFSEGGMAPAQTAKLALSGVLGIAVGDTLFFMALVRLEPRVTLLVATLGHLFTMLLAALLLGERPPASAWLGSALVLGGVFVVLREGQSGGGSPSGDWRAGIGYGVLSAVATSGGLLLAKVGVAEASTLQATWVRLFAGVIALVLWGAARGHLGADLRSLGAPGLFRAIGIAVAVVMFGGFWLSLVALKYTHASIATALAASEPLFILPLARWWLHERVSARALVGALGATGGVLLIVASLV